MNKISRLTALLLALMMILSTFAAAETSYQVGQMTTEQWQQMVEQAENELYVIEPGDSGETVTPEIPDKPVQGEFAPYADGTKTTLIVSEEAVSAVRTASGVAVLTHSAAGQWQMFVGDVWADLSGEDGAELWVTPEMMHGMTTAEFRKALADETFTQTAKVTVQEKKPVMMASARAGEGANENAADTSADPFSLQRANEGLEKHLITINYLFQNNNEVAANPYYAEISTTTATFSATVKHPTIVGYQPVVIPAEDMPTGFACNDTQITIDNASIENDVTITVYYEPAEVVYTINYWEEKTVYTIDPATGEEVKYDLKATRREMGLTGSTVKAASPNPDAEQYWAKQHTPEGFMALLYDENVKIAADGSTVVDVYYQRLYTLIVFNLGGGYGVNPIYAKYGTNVGNIGTPRRPGYVHKGWTKDKDKTIYTANYDGKLETIPTTVPNGNVTYYAVWEPQNTEFIVAYWLEDPNVDGKYNFWGSYKEPGVVGNVVQGVNYKDNLDQAMPVPDKYDRYYADFDHADENVVLSGDGDTVVNVYYNRHKFTLKFYYSQQSGDTHYVIGGSTFKFGATADDWVNKNDEVALLSYYMTNYTTERGVVAEQPTLNAKGNARGYTMGSDETTAGGQTYQYHYLSFTAKYGADISKLWPCDVFNPVEELNEQGNGWNGNMAYQSAWNGEHHVYFSQHLHRENNANQTIKGNYDRLDYKLLWDNGLSGCSESYGDSDTVAYLCFWENGAKNDWNVPELYRYKIWVPVFEGQDTSNLETRQRAGITYYMRDMYDTIDNSIPHAQIAPAIMGFSCINENTQLWDDYWPAQDNYQKTWVGEGKVDSNGNYAWLEVPDEYYEHNEDGSLKLDASNNPIKTVRYAYEINWFYERNRYDITFANYGAIKAETGIPFEKDISGLYYVPDYPEEQQEGTLTFAGWYTSQDFIDGTKFEFTTMPDHNIMLYACWKPITHSVKVYWTKEEADAGINHKWHFEKVKHGNSTASSYTFDNPNHFDPDSSSFEEPKREGMIFTYWFYYDENGKEQAFSFNDTPITRDTIVYAGWTADSLASYTIYYVKAGTAADEVAVEANWVAAPTYGSGLVGATTTERAKGGTELHSAYQTGYFPTLESHSFTLNVDASKNVYVFEYVSKEKVPYKVQYLEAGTDAVLAPEKWVTDNDKAVVTENYVQISGNYVPDAFQKRLVLKADSTIDENVIVFYYTKELTSTTLEVNHFLVHADGSKTLHDSMKQIVNDLPEEITVETITVANYVYDLARSERFDGTSKINSFEGLSFTLEEGAEGVVLNLYYVEETVTINYVAVGPDDATNFGTVTPATETVGKVTGMPGSTAVAENGYKFVGWYSDAACTVRVGTDAVFAPAKENGVHVAATYYAKFEHLPGQLNITKMVVNNTGEALNQTAFTFTVTLTDVNGHPLTGNVEYTIGSQTHTAALQEGKFSLTLDVGTVTGTTITASATASIADLPYGVQYVVTETPVDNCSVTVENVSGSIRAAETVTATITNTFPAATVSSLKITKNGMSNGESAVFKVELETGTYMLVLNSANPSETILNVPIDSTYTVTELDKWSWRYNDAGAQSGTIQRKDNNVEFTNSRTNTQWMSDESCVVNNVTEGKQIDSLNNQ